MTSTFDIDAYFWRIGYTGERTPSLSVLSAINRLHAEAIPFENLNAYLGLPVYLDIDSIQKKLVHGGRGGWCFEHNILFSHVLRELGFSVKWLAARVLWNVPDGTVMPRTHMVLLVDIEGQPYLADTGFGGMILTTPIKLIAGVEQETSHEPFRLEYADGSYILQAYYAGRWNSLYRFDLNEQHLVDYELTNWYLGNNPDSRFVNNILAARVEQDRRYALFNNKFAIHHLHGETEKHELTSAAELRKTLEEVFRITMPDVPTLDQELQRLIGSH